MKITINAQNVETLRDGIRAFDAAVLAANSADSDITVTLKAPVAKPNANHESSAKHGDSTSTMDETGAKGTATTPASASDENKDPVQPDEQMIDAPQDKRHLEHPTLAEAEAAYIKMMTAKEEEAEAEKLELDVYKRDVLEDFVSKNEEEQAKTTAIVEELGGKRESFKTAIETAKWVLENFENAFPEDSGK